MPLKSATVDTTPIWADHVSIPRFPRLERTLEVDVVVVGGGLMGLTAAYLLSAEGKSVAVLERDRLGHVDTGHTSAHLTMVIDRRLTELASSMGRNHAQAVWDAGLAALARIETIVREEALSCDFAWVPGYLHDAGPDRSSRPAERRQMEQEAALAGDLGFDASFVDEVPFAGGPGVRFEDQARFHPRKYLAGLARVLDSRGVRLFEHSAAEAFSEGPRSVKANGHTISCDWIVLATHTPLMGNTGTVRAAAFQTKLALYTSYVVAGRVKKETIPDALFWDTANPYHYLRLDRHRDHDVAIFGGSDHKSSAKSATTPATGTSATSGQQGQVVAQAVLGPIGKTFKGSGAAFVYKSGNQSFVIVRAKLPPSSAGRKYVLL